MKKLLFPLVWLALSIPLQAQNMTATATWVQLNTLTDAQAFPYALKDGATSTPLSGVICRVVGGVTECHATVPLPSQGHHDFSIVTTGTNAATPFLIGVQNGAPNGYTVTITVKPAMRD